MNRRDKRSIRDKARLAYCLVDILEYDMENLKAGSNECRPEELERTLEDTKVTLQNLTDLIVEIEYILYLDKIRES